MTRPDGGTGGTTGSGGSGTPGAGGVGGGGNPLACTGVEHWAPLGPIPGIPADRFFDLDAWTADRLFAWSQAWDPPVLAGVYDMKVGEWSLLSTELLSPRLEPIAAMVGSRAVVWGGVGDDVFQDGAIYDLSTNL